MPQATISSSPSCGPPVPVGTLPVFMFFHAVIWVLGDFHPRARCAIWSSLGAAAVFVNYTPSPRHYPVAIKEAYAATQWVAEHGPRSRSTASAAVAGSLGGNMAAVVALMARTKYPAIRYQVLFWP